jgi:hypothetical protein
MADSEPRSGASAAERIAWVIWDSTMEEMVWWIEPKTVETPCKIWHATSLSWRGAPRFYER